MEVSADTLRAHMVEYDSFIKSQHASVSGPVVVQILSRSPRIFATVLCVVGKFVSGFRAWSSGVLDCVAGFRGLRVGIQGSGFKHGA